MKIMSSIKFQLYDTKKALAVFYGVVFGILVIAATAGSGNAEVRGMEMASAIFIFVVGLNSFRSTFHFSLANGVSRKTQFIGFLASISVLSALMVVIDSIYTLVFSNVMPYSSLYVQLYYRNSPFSYSSDLLTGLAWSFLLYLMSALLGYMICLIYYRSGLAMKLVVSIAPPVALFIGLPYLALNNPESAQRFIDFTGKALGLYPQAAPLNAMATFFCFFLLFSAASYLLMRRAQIKQ